MIPKHHSLQVADAILDAVNLLIRDNKIGGWLECFDNCREQGYCFTSSEINIAFCQHRSSDWMIVYKYKKKQHPNNLPVEEEWSNSKMFKYDQVWECAQYIIEILKENNLLKD